MRPRNRKLIGTALLVVLVPIYALFISAVAELLPSDASILARTLFFAVTGLLWVLPAGALLGWMLRRRDDRQG
ncbi:MAG: DUF2842 domain-containing protein [Bauldia sp.]